MIKYYDRRTGKYETERVAGGHWLNWLYTSALGKGVLELFIKKKIASRLYGAYCDRAGSRKKIQKFIRELEIDMSGFEVPAEGFKTFNEFFYRALKEEGADFGCETDIFPAPCEGKLLAFENIDICKLIQVKGLTYSLAELLGGETLSADYEEGVCLIFRLNPANYHRFHFVDRGVCSPASEIKGWYYSVNPISLQSMEKVFCANKREWSILHSENFGDVLYVEVGATFVGSIVQTYRPLDEVQRGGEKGYFKFGGSTVILFLKKNIVAIDRDILEQSALEIESCVKLGEKIGVRLGS